MRLARTLIGMLHLQPLPGSPRWEGSMARVIDGALADARALVEGGMDALLVENYGDAPFTAGRVAAATVAGVTAVAGEIRRAFDQKKDILVQGIDFQLIGPSRCSRWIYVQ